MLLLDRHPFWVISEPPISRVLVLCSLNCLDNTKLAWYIKLKTAKIESLWSWFRLLYLLSLSSLLFILGRSFHSERELLRCSQCDSFNPFLLFFQGQKEPFLVHLQVKLEPLKRIWWLKKQPSSPLNLNLWINLSKLRIVSLILSMKNRKKRQEVSCLHNPKKNFGVVTRKNNAFGEAECCKNCHFQPR